MSVDCLNAVSHRPMGYSLTCVFDSCTGLLSSISGYVPPPTRTPPQRPDGILADLRGLTLVCGTLFYMQYVRAHDASNPNAPMGRPADMFVRLSHGASFFNQGVRATTNSNASPSPRWGARFSCVMFLAHRGVESLSMVAQSTLTLAPSMGTAQEP